MGGSAIRTLKAIHWELNERLDGPDERVRKKCEQIDDDSKTLKTDNQVLPSELYRRG